MNRGQLEELAVRLYMLEGRYRIKKRDREKELQRVKVLVTKYSEAYLVTSIFVYMTKLEVM